MLRDCRALSLKVSVLPRLADVLGPAVEIDDVEGVTVLGLNPPWLPRSSRAIKRGMDLLIATPLLILVAPLLAVLAIAIKLDSRGPVFFAQERVGRGGRHFRLFKLRTMTADAERAPRGAARPEHRSRLAEARPRSAGHSRRPMAAAAQPGRAAAALECRPRRDEPGRARAR